MQSTCSINTCDKKISSRGYCVSHYSMWRRTGNPIRACIDCGADITGTRGGAKSCPSCRVCTVDGCSKPRRTRKMCNMHAKRINAYGTTSKACASCGEEMPYDCGSAIYCSDLCKPRCKARGCAAAKRYGSGYCLRHNELNARNGRPDRVHQFTEESEEYTCLVCGDKFTPNGTSRQFCHANCQGLYSRYGGDVPPLDFTCAICDDFIKWEPGPSAWRRRDRRICGRCRNAGQTRHKTSPGVLAERDGTDCGICGDPVNMASRWPAPDSASVDHIVPVSHGGGHELENLQLSHWSCNHKKRDQLDYVPG